MSLESHIRGTGVATVALSALLYCSEKLDSFIGITGILDNLAIWQGWLKNYGSPFLLFVGLGLLVWNFSRHNAQWRNMAYFPSFTWSIIKSDSQPIRIFIPVTKATKKAIRQTYGSAIGKVAHLDFPKGRSADPDRYFAIFLMATREIPIYGRNKITGSFERIVGDKRDWEFANSLSELISRKNGRVAYDQLAFRLRDFHQEMYDLNKSSLANPAPGVVA